MTTGYAGDKYDMYRPEIWTPRITRYMREKFYAAKFFLDYSADIVNADTVHIPHISDQFSITAIPTTTGEVTLTDISETKTDLSVDQWYGAAFVMTKFEQREIMKRPNIINEYSKAIGHKLGRTVETAILANLTSVTPVAGDSVTDLYSTNLETAFGILESNSVPKEECRIFIKPKVYWDDIMSIQKYYDASQFGRATVPNGAHDILYGVPLVMTSNLPESYTTTSLGLTNAIVHYGAIAFALGGADFTTKETEHLRKKIIGDTMYGDVILNPTWGVQLMCTSD